MRRREFLASIGAAFAIASVPSFPGGPKVSSPNLGKGKFTDEGVRHILDVAFQGADPGKPLLWACSGDERMFVLELTDREEYQYAGEATQACNINNVRFYNGEDALVGYPVKLGPLDHVCMVNGDTLKVHLPTVQNDNVG